MNKKGKKGMIGKKLSKKSETHGNKSKIGKGGQDCMTIIFWRSQTRWGGNMSKKGKIGKKLFKKLETHGNKSKICKEGQVYMTTIFKDRKQGGVATWVRKVRFEKKNQKIGDPR